MQGTPVQNKKGFVPRFSQFTFLYYNCKKVHLAMLVVSAGNFREKCIYIFLYRVLYVCIFFIELYDVMI